MENKIYIQPDWGLFIGRFSDNKLHKHYALQISVAEKSFSIRDEQGTDKAFKLCLINSNVLHQFQSDQVALILLINPLSSIGHQLVQKYQQTPIADLAHAFQPFAKVFQSFVADDISFTDLIARLNLLLSDFKNANQQLQVEDDRIYKAIQYLEAHADRIVSLKEIAAYSFLSETRFLHLFKEKTAINFRRYQLWNKLIKSLPFLTKQSITETAHQFGFTDSSHYNRSFKETFGLNPKILTQLK